MHYHILLIKCKILLVQRLGNLNSSIGQRKNSQLPSFWAAGWNILTCHALLHYIYESWRECEGSLNFDLIASCPQYRHTIGTQHLKHSSLLVFEIMWVKWRTSLSLLQQKPQMKLHFWLQLLNARSN